MAKAPKRKPPITKKEPPAKKPPVDIDWGDDDFEEDFTYKEAVRRLQAEYDGLVVTPTLERQIRAFILAADTEGKPGLNEARMALRDSLDEIMDDGITANRVLAEIYQFVDGDVPTKPKENPLEIKRKLINAMEVITADRIDAIRGNFATTNATDSKGIKALTKLAKSFREGHPGYKEAELLNLIAEAAIAGKLPQAHDATYFEQLKMQVSDHLTQDVLDGRGSLARRVMNDAILSAATEVTAPLIGKVGK